MDNLFRRILYLTCLILFFILIDFKFSIPCWASQNVVKETILEKEEIVETALVILDGEELFRLRGVSSFPAVTRAKTVSKRIRDAAKVTSIPVSQLKVVEKEDRSTLLMGDQLLLNIMDADAIVEGVSRQILSEAIFQRTKGAITSYRHDRSWENLIRAIGYALALMVGLGLFYFLLSFIFRKLNLALDRSFKEKLEGIESKSFRLLRAKSLAGLLRNCVSGLHFILIFVALVFTLQNIFGLFPWTRSIRQQMFLLIRDPIKGAIMAFIGSLPNLVIIALIIFGVRYLLKIIRLFFSGIESGAIQLKTFDREWAQPTYRIVRFLIILFSLVIAYPNIPGSESPVFKGISIFLGVLFSLGSSSFLSNIIAGYTLTYRRAFKMGDRISIGDIIGDVTLIGVLVTHIRTTKNEDVNIPNSSILTSPILNFSTYAKSNGLILHTTVGIGYETPWRQVESLLLMAADRTVGLLKNPSPFVLQKALGDFSVTYEINGYCQEPQNMPSLYTSLNQNILDVFNEYGVQIMTPAYESDPGQKKIVPPEEWFREPAKKGGVELKKVGK